MMTLEIKHIQTDDREQVQQIVTHFWADEIMVVRGEIFHTADLPGLKAVRNDRIVGILHYQISGQECEILTLASLQENQSIGSALLLALESLAKNQQCKKVTLITTNDNLHALGFYQRRGYKLAALYPDQVTLSRKIKPGIPLVGEHNIPIRDELKLEKLIESH
jgi:ribosomal protein S18 acetylase RimI-like enzyme